MSDLIGKTTEEIEKENGFVWYVEFKPKKMFGFDLEEHHKLMKVFIEFLPEESMKILKLNDGEVEEVFELDNDEVLKNIELLKDSKGKFYEKDDKISYSILTNSFFIIIQQGMIFWSSGKELAKDWSNALDKNDLDFHKMGFVGNGGELWEDKTKVNGVWVDDKTGEVLEDE